MTIGDNIRRIRKERGLTQKQLGNLCGINEAQIRRYELGGANSNPKIETILKIAKALKVSSHQIDPSLGELMTFDTPEDFHKEWDKITNNARINDMTSLMTQMNAAGQNKALEQVELLTKIPEYQQAQE